MYNAYEMSDSMMKCKIKMTRKSKKDVSDKFAGTYIGDVVNKDDCLCFRYTEFDTGARCFVLYEDDEVTIKRTAETRSKLVLNDAKETVAEIVTPYGEMEMKIRTYDVTRHANSLHVCYSLVEGNDETDIIDITWEIMKEGIS